MENNKSIITAPEVSNAGSFLAAYQIFSGNKSATVSDFYTLLVCPSVERDDFFNLYCNSFPVVEDNYIHNKYIVK